MIRPFYKLTLALLGFSIANLGFSTLRKKLFDHLKKTKNPRVTCGPVI